MWSLKNKFWSKTQAFLKKATPEMRYVDSCRKRLDDPHSCILIRANQYLALKMTNPSKIVFKTMHEKKTIQQFQKYEPCFERNINNNNNNEKNDIEIYIYIYIYNVSNLLDHGKHLFSRKNIWTKSIFAKSIEKCLKTLKGNTDKNLKINEKSIQNERQKNNAQTTLKCLKNVAKRWPDIIKKATKTEVHKATWK